MGRRLAVRDSGVYLESVEATTQNNTFAPGAVLVDEWDPIIFDDLLRKFPAWDIIEKRPAPGDFTNGFQQTDYGSARSADKRTMSYSASAPTRSARVPKEIKAIVRDLTFGIYDMSVYAQQGKKFGDLTMKDVNDIYFSLMAKWADLLYNGSVSGNALEFDGLKTLLTAASATSTVLANKSVIKAIQNQVVAMVQNKKEVKPTHVLVNARVKQMIADEYLKAGSALVWIKPGGVPQGQNIPTIDTAVGDLPLVVDTFNSVVTGTPNYYPTFIISDDKLRWEYIEPLGMAGPEPKIFELPIATNLDQLYKGLMFGAIDFYGGSTHHFELDVQERTTVVDPSA